MTDLISELRQSVADRYAVEREVGRGGMATVFLAQDLRHRRPVALKLYNVPCVYSLGGMLDEAIDCLALLQKL